MKTETKLTAFTLGLALPLAPPGLAATSHPPQAGFGTALQFDGTDDGVRLPDALATNVGGRDAITIEYWFKGTQLQSPVRFQDGDGYIVAGWNENSPVHIISTDGGTDTGLSVGPESTVENGQWHHLAMTWQRNTVNGFRSYLDGALVAQRNSADVALPSLSSATPYLGCLWGSSEFLAGQLDEVRIWKTALSGTVVSNWMYRSADPTHPAWSNLVAYYKLNEGTGTNATDSAGTNTGTLVNMSVSAWTDSTIGRQLCHQQSAAGDSLLPVLVEPLVHDDRPLEPGQRRLEQRAWRRAAHGRRWRGLDAGYERAAQGSVLPPEGAVAVVAKETLSIYSVDEEGAAFGGAARRRLPDRRGGTL
jgi:hypothetical protein